MNILSTLTITIVMCVLAYYIIPYVKAHTTAAQREAILGNVDELVEAAEQLFGPSTGAAKLEAVQKWLNEKRIDVDVNVIEAAVLRLPATGHGWLAAHSQDANAIPATNVPAMAKALQDGQSNVKAADNG
jgi:hypothetical protein